MLTQGEERDNSKYICTYRDARKDVWRVDQTSSKHWRYGFSYALETRFRPNRPAADMEANGEFDFWVIYEDFWRIF